MLLKDKMNHYQFSPSETIVIQYILQAENIDKLSIKDIAEATYTSPSLLIRIAKKLGYKGWVDLKNDYIKEMEYLENHFLNIDPNLPFKKNDSIMAISSKITTLYVESAKDTLALIEHDSLQKAVQMLNDANNITLFGVANILYNCMEFKTKLRHIQKRCIVEPYQDEQNYEAQIAKPTDCAIIISYSGESKSVLHIMNILKEKHVPTIVITSVGENTLSKSADVVLHLTTREKNYNKIAGYTSLSSINLLLDILYSCLFSLNYEQNLYNKVELNKSLDRRNIQNEILEDY